MGGHFFKISSVSHLAFNFFFPKGNQIIQNNQRATTSNLNVIQPTVHMISRPQAFWADTFSKCPPSAILFLMNSSQKLIRSSEIPREPPIQFECDPTNGSYDIAPTSFLGGHFFKISFVSHLAFNIFFPKGNQIIQNNQRTTISNLNVIQPTVHMISRPQAFWADTFSKCPPSAMLFLMNSSKS